MTQRCLCCGHACPEWPIRWHYCGVPCAETQIRTIGLLLHSTPRPALSPLEWHDLSSSYMIDLDTLHRFEPVVA
ncbi:MAG TPA: hypothetical protein VFB50_06485 [Chloroflexota bacterium]|nr:hypothetical protein [Chloroflexota bacterium]